MTTAIHPNDMESRINDKLQAEADAFADGNPTPAEESPEAASAETLPSLPELKQLHYERIVAQNKRVRESFYEWKMADAQAKRLKKVYEGEAEGLSELIQRDPAQRELPLAEGDTPLPADESWRHLYIEELDVADHIVGKLDSHGIVTLGDLQNHWRAGKTLRELKGIGEAADTSVVDAFAKYGAEHPEVFGQSPATESSDADDPEAELKSEMRGEFEKRGILA